MATKEPKKEWNDLSRNEKIAGIIVFVVVGLLLIGFISTISGGTNSSVAEDNTSTKTVDAEQVTPTDSKPVPPFDTYLNRPMAEIATDFGQQYDPSSSLQINAEKDGYSLYFENGVKFADANDVTGEYDNTANIVSIELSQMGKCEQGQVFNKIDEAMRIVKLDTSTKGDKYDGAGGTQLGYGAYRNYLGRESLELALICDYRGDDYRLQLRVLPEFR